MTLSGGWRPYLTKENESIITLPVGELLRVGVKRIFSDLYPLFYTYFLTKYLQKEKPDVLLAEYGITGVGVMEACRKTNTPLVVHFHGFDASHRPTIEQYRKEYKRLFEIASKIVVVSNDMAEQLITLGAPESKIINNPYGVETEKFYGGTPQNSEKLVLSVGRFAGKKAPHLTIKAFDKVLEKHPDAKLVMIGGGELLTASQKLVEELQLKHAVAILGVKTPDEIAEMEADTTIRWDMEDVEFIRELIEATNQHAGFSEGLIERFSQNWDSERITLLDSILLRMTIAELISFPEIPPKVSINVALDLAKRFSTDNSPAFINGMLDGIYTELQEQNLIQKTGRGLVDK